MTAAPPEAAGGPMTPNRCPHCTLASAGIPIYGSPLVLCPACLAVFDPAAPAAPPPPPPAPSPVADTPWPAEPPASVPPPAPLPRPVPAPPLPAVVDELASLDYRPRSRLGPLLSRWTVAFLTFVIVLPISVYGAWFSNKTYPRFREYAAPDGGYVVAFPSKPRWSEWGLSRGGFMSGAEAEIDNWMWDEVYAVRAAWQGRTIAEQGPSQVAYRRAVGSVWPRVIRVRSDLPVGDAVVDFERWDPELRRVVVGRVVVTEETVYELTVSGRGISLDDWRVRRFFDSFRPAR